VATQFDGDGTGRLLTEITAAVTDANDDDAFGNVVNSIRTTSNTCHWRRGQDDRADWK